MGAEPAPGVRGAALSGDDVLRGEWDLAVLGPHFAGALVARDLGDAGPTSTAGSSSCSRSIASSSSTWPRH